MKKSVEPAARARSSTVAKVRARHRPPPRVGSYASRCKLCACLFLFLPTFLLAQEKSFDTAASSARDDLEAALNELKDTRAVIAGEKIPLVRRQRELEAEVGRLRRELERQQRLRDSRQGELESLRSELERREGQHHYQAGLLSEYLRELEAALPVSEIETVAPRLRQARSDAGTGSNPGSEGRGEPEEGVGASSLAPELEAVHFSLERLRDQIGGRAYDGEAAGAEGAIERGRFLEIGPVILFRGESFAGLAGERVGSLKAHVVTPGRDRGRQVRDLVETGRGMLPLDATLGKASRRAEARTTVAQRIQGGGVVMVPILALALVALVVAFLKWVQIAGMRVATPAALQEILALLDKGEKGQAARRAAAIRGPVGELLQAAIENAHERKEILEEILYERILRTQPRLERYLPFLALTAATAPLLGLLGTVTGMINTFQLITLFGTGDARTLSGGISEALITTQFGLGVAIAALLVHSLLSRKAKGVVSNMEQTEAAFLNGRFGAEVEAAQAEPAGGLAAKGPETT